MSFYTLSTIVSIGFFSSFFGALLGIITAEASRKMGRRGEGALTGFTAGLLIAFVCFNVLEEGFDSAPLYICVLGIISGAGAAVWLDGASSGIKGRGARASVITALGVMLHHFPEGIALGGVYAASPKQGAILAAVILLHCIPEATAVFIPFRDGTSGFFRLVPYAAALSLPMAAGSLIGALLTNISVIFQAFALTFAGGVMLYITCGEMLPESKRLWNGRLTTLCSIAGFILGVVITV